MKGPLVAAGLALAVGVLAERAALNGEWNSRQVAVDAAVGVASVLAGLVAWIARPRSLVGPVLVAIGGLWFLGSFGYGHDMAAVDYVGFPLQGWHDVLLVALLLAVTPGGVREPAARVIVIGALAAQTVLALGRLLLRPPLDATTCFCVGNRITGITEPAAYDAVVRSAGLVEAGFAVAALVLLALRWRAAAPTARRTLAPLVGAGAVAAALTVYTRVTTKVLTTPTPSGDTLLEAMAVARIAIPVAIVFSLLRGRRARARVADVVISLDRGDTDAAMRRALADPRLQLLRWEDGAYRDGEGRAVPLPAPGEPLSATLLERDGTALGALVHDAALREEPELLDAVAAAGRLALHNERLLEDARASRRRIVESGDAERRQLERDLHDGAQQRLVALLLSLRTLERRTGEAGDVALADQLDALAAELSGALGEIRDLAHGIRPPVLEEEGLGPALLALAARVPVTVEADVRLSRRLEPAVETAGYFAAAEALANALKYAGAAHVRLTAGEDGAGLVISVRDDGRGGADPSHGSGLVGLGDRLEALGGSLTVESPAGGGTTVTARLPAHAG